MRCATNRADRVLFAVAAVFTGAAAASLIDNLWCAIPAALCSIMLTLAAVTGWCPAALLPLGRVERPAHRFGYPSAPQRIELTPLSR
jgi:hypothetical protein